MGPVPALGTKDRPVWTLFDDWCAGADMVALPADPFTLGAFIAENPAALATQRRRITVVNTVHRSADLPAPGNADTIRRMIGRVRAQRLSELRSTISEIVDHLPTAGWTAGLFGRRDGLLLLLAVSGLSFEHISALRRCDLHIDDDTLVVESIHTLTLPPFHLPGSLSPAQIYQQWSEILAFQDRAPSTRLLADRLDTDTLPTSYPPSEAAEQRTAKHQADPLFTPIDRWGHTPFGKSVLSAQSIARVFAAHVNGQAATHHPHRRTARRTDDAPAYEPIVYPEVVLDDRHYEAGIEARRRAHEALTDVTSTLDDIENRADAILERLLAVLDSAL
ncbi:recombinase [Rhodococcus sp. NPDC076796]|uniref:recombinase n=1 Tax=Rhodococcus sp. NPDC076796 TaxID=3154859 RepID=UPI00344B982F